MKHLSRRLLFSGLSAGAVLGVSACGQEKIERLEPSVTATAVDSDTVKTGSHPRKWVHIGDSFTAISNVVEDLSNLTGYEHINAGVSGDKSINAAVRTGAISSKISLEGDLVEGSGQSLVVDLSPVDFVAKNSWKYPVRISDIDGYLIGPVSSDVTYFEPKSDILSDFSIEPMTDLIVDPMAEENFLRKGPENNYSMIVGLGRNDIDLTGDISGLIENVNKIIQLNSESSSRYLVWEIPPWSDEPVGSDGRKQLDLWNDSLSREFGDFFVRPISAMIGQATLAFEKAGITPTNQDLSDIEEGLIPTSFRKDRKGHLNDVGSRPWAYFMYQEMKKRGW